jgi:hypothetical protein
MNSSQIISFSQRLIIALVMGVTLWIGGCGDFLTDKTAGRESTNILDDLGRVETATEPNIPMPSIYKEPPKIVEQIVGGAPEFKLFYFCKHLSAAELEAIVYKMFATKVFNKKGQSTTLKDYTVSSVATTNQLIVRCPTREDVDAVLELLQEVDVPPIQVKISCLISEVYADKTLDWETTTAIENLLGENIWAAPSARPFGQDVVQWLVENDPLAAFPGASMREFGRAKMGLNVGYLSQSHKFMALVDILESQGYLKILMNPTLEVINGKTAKVTSTQRVPVDKIFLTSTRADFFTSRTDWADIVDSLEITPHVFANGYIGLETDIVIGSKLTPEGIKQLPIVTTKKITNKENRIRPGESLIIGGLRKSERRDVLRGLPFLKDIPLIGMLFSGRDFEERAVETIFILTPTFSTGGIPREEMKKEVERRHEPVSTGKAHEAITDPLDILDGKRDQQRKAKEAEEARMKAEAEKAEARAAVRDAEDRIERAITEAEKAITEADKAKADAQAATEKAADVEKQSKAEAAKAKADANTATVKAVAIEKQAKADVAKAKADLQKVTAEAAQAKADTAKAQTAAKTATEKAAEIVQQAQAQIEKLKAELEKLKAETEKSKADSQNATAEAEKAKADAKKAAAEAAKAKADAEKAKKEAEAKEKEESAEETKEATEQAKTEEAKEEAKSQEKS